MNIYVNKQISWSDTINFEGVRSKPNEKLISSGAVITDIFI